MGIDSEKERAIYEYRVMLHDRGIPADDMSDDEITERVARDVAPFPGTLAARLRAVEDSILTAGMTMARLLVPCLESLRHAAERIGCYRD